MFNVVLIFTIRSKSGIKSLHIKQAEFIGPVHIVEECSKIVYELMDDSPELFKALFEQAGPVFCFVPEINRGFVNARRIFVGGQFLVWREAGIRACFVAAAYRVRAELHHPSVFVNDIYNGGVLAADAADKTSVWLRVHQQPDELAQYFADISNRRRERR